MHIQMYARMYMHLVSTYVRTYVPTQLYDCVCLLYKAPRDEHSGTIAAHDESYTIHPIVQMSNTQTTVHEYLILKKVNLCN